MKLLGFGYPRGTSGTGGGAGMFCPEGDRGRAPATAGESGVGWMGTATALTAAVAWLDVKMLQGALVGSDTGWLSSWHSRRSCQNPCLKLPCSLMHRTKHLIRKRKHSLSNFHLRISFGETNRKKKYLIVWSIVYLNKQKNIIWRRNFLKHSVYVRMIVMPISHKFTFACMFVFRWRSCSASHYPSNATYLLMLSFSW